MGLMKIDIWYQLVQKKMCPLNRPDLYDTCFLDKLTKPYITCHVLATTSQNRTYLKKKDKKINNVSKCLKSDRPELNNICWCNARPRNAMNRHTCWLARSTNQRPCFQLTYVSKTLMLSKYLHMIRPLELGTGSNGTSVSFLQPPFALAAGGHRFSEAILIS